MGTDLVVLMCTLLHNLCELHIYVPFATGCQTGIFAYACWYRISSRPPLVDTSIRRMLLCMLPQLSTHVQLHPSTGLPQNGLRPLNGIIPCMRRVNADWSDNQ